MIRSSVSRPFIIPVFIPHAGCPHRCVFCDQNAITGKPDNQDLIAAAEESIRTWLDYPGAGRSQAEIAFYGGNFLGLDESTVRALLDTAGRVIGQGKAVGIRFSTRPDTITSRRLSWIAGHPVSMVELGAQSLRDRVLEASGRGHTVRDTVNGVSRLKAENLRVGIQLMTGLPGDDPDGAMESARHACRLEPDAVRIYPTLVLKGSELERWMRQGAYHPAGLEESVILVAEMYRLFYGAGIPVIRMGLHADTDLHSGACLAAGPFHPSFGHLVQARVFYDALVRKLSIMHAPPCGVHIRVHPSSISRARGWKNRNIERLCNDFSIETIHVHPDPELTEDQIGIENDSLFSVFPDR